MTDIAIRIELPESNVEILIDQRREQLQIPLIIPIHSPCENNDTMAPKSGQIILSWPCSKRSSPVCHDKINKSPKLH